MYTDPYGLFGLADLPTLPGWFVNGSAGFGDGASFGMTYAVRVLMGTNDFVNPCSEAYQGSLIAGLVVGTIGYNEGAELRIGKNFRSPPWGNRTDDPYGR